MQKCRGMLFRLSHYTICSGYLLLCNESLHNSIAENKSSLYLITIWIRDLYRAFIVGVAAWVEPWLGWLRLLEVDWASSFPSPCGYLGLPSTYLPQDNQTSYLKTIHVFKNQFFKIVETRFLRCRHSKFCWILWWKCSLIPPDSRSGNIAPRPLNRRNVKILWPSLFCLTTYMLSQLKRFFKLRSVTLLSKLSSLLEGLVKFESGFEKHKQRKKPPFEITVSIRSYISPFLFEVENSDFI